MCVIVASVLLCDPGWIYVLVSVSRPGRVCVDSCEAVRCACVPMRMPDCLCFHLHDLVTVLTMDVALSGTVSSVSTQL